MKTVVYLLAEAKKRFGMSIQSLISNPSREEPDGAVRFVLKDGTEIHRLPPPDRVYDLDTAEPCGRLDRRGRVLPLLPPAAREEDVFSEISNFTHENGCLPAVRETEKGFGTSA